LASCLRDTNVVSVGHHDADRVAFTYDHPRPSVTVDSVIFGFDPQSGLQLLLIRRAGAPYHGMWALPGGFVRVSDEGDQGEDLEAAARRELEEETGVKVSYLEQLYTFGKPGRDPRGRVMSVAYMALVRAHDHDVVGRDDAAEAEWFPVSTLLSGKRPLAFDHDEIIHMGVTRLQGKVRYAPIGFNLLARTFTLSELQSLYEAVLLRQLDKRNFRRRILAMGILASAGQQENVPHRAATLYRFDKRAYDRALRDGFNFEV
jgi:8-oxo-dGTP diphosphatase